VGGEMTLEVVWEAKLCCKEIYLAQIGLEKRCTSDIKRYISAAIFDKDKDNL